MHKKSTALIRSQKGRIAQMINSGITFVKNTITILLSTLMTLVFVGSVTAEETISFHCSVDDRSVGIYKLGDKYESEFARYYAEVGDKKIAEELTIQSYKRSHMVVLIGLVIDVDVDDTVSVEGGSMGRKVQWMHDEVKHFQFMGKTATLVTINRTDLSYNKFYQGGVWWSSPLHTGICEITVKGKRKF